jgi:hypothetical protein
MDINDIRNSSFSRISEWKEVHHFLNELLIAIDQFSGMVKQLYNITNVNEVKALEKQWQTCQDRIDTLVKFARMVKHISPEPYHEENGDRRGPPWAVDIIPFQQQLDQILQKTEYENILEAIKDIQPLDHFSHYEIGLRQLVGRLGQSNPYYKEALVYQQRLLENIKAARRYGDDSSRISARNEINERLNELTLSALDMSFNELCILSAFVHELRELAGTLSHVCLIHLYVADGNLRDEIRNLGLAPKQPPDSWPDFASQNLPETRNLFLGDSSGELP